MMSRFRPGVNPDPEQLFCLVPIPTLPLVSMRTFSRTFRCSPAPIPNNYTVPEAPIRGGPERRRRIASANPQKP
jgi:hypothetical protein